jgi:hypothetical protein
MRVSSTPAPAHAHTQSIRSAHSAHGTHSIGIAPLTCNTNTSDVHSILAVDRISHQLPDTSCPVTELKEEEKDGKVIDADNPTLAAADAAAVTDAGDQETLTPGMVTAAHTQAE